MTQGKFIELGAGAACVALASLAWAQPKEIIHDTVSCWGGTYQMLVNTPTERYGTWAVAGSMRATVPGGPGDGDSFDCSGMLEFRAGVFGTLGYCVVADKDGHHVYVREVGGPKGVTHEIVGGTGKYVGATGSGAGERLPGAGPVRASISQGCRKNRLTLKMP